MIWAIIFAALGLVGCVFVIVYGLRIRKRRAVLAEEARLLSRRADEARKLLARLETRTGD